MSSSCAFASCPFNNKARHPAGPRVQGQLEAWKFGGLEVWLSLYSALFVARKGVLFSVLCSPFSGRESALPLPGRGAAPHTYQSANQLGAPSERLPKQVEQALEQAPKGLNQDTNQRILHLLPPFWVHGRLRREPLSPESGPGPRPHTWPCFQYSAHCHLMHTVRPPPCPPF